MVENTIVFGNRYRSTYADIDSELTRAELCFRNGQYTKALKIGIQCIEKIHPVHTKNDGETFTKVEGWKNNMIYLDYASTTPIRKEVLETYTMLLHKYYGNSDSLHEIGRENF